MAEIFADVGLWALLGMAGTILLAAILRAFTGFGFALAALPVLSMFLSPTTAASVIVLLTLTISIQTLPSYRADVPLRTMGGMLVLSALGTLGGTYLLLLFSADTFRLLIGLTVMLACVLLMRFKPAPHREGGVYGLAAGLSSGLMNGALAIPGPPVIIYAMAVYSEARKSRAFLMGFFLISAAIATCTYSYKGIMGLQEVSLALVAYPAMLVGDKLGATLFEKHGTTTHRKIAIFALFAIGSSVAAAAIFR